MAYLKPPWFVRKIFNRVAMATGIGNSQTLTVIKRVSKQPQQIPVVVPEVGGVDLREAAPAPPDRGAYRFDDVGLDLVEGRRHRGAEAGAKAALARRPSRR